LPVTVNTYKKFCVNSATDNHLRKTLLVNTEVHLYLFSKCIFVNWKCTCSLNNLSKNRLQIIVRTGYSAKLNALWNEIQPERLRNIHIPRYKVECPVQDTQSSCHMIHTTLTTGNSVVEGRYAPFTVINKKSNVTYWKHAMRMKEVPSFIRAFS
jgi:hypothetical protein